MRTRVSYLVSVWGLLLLAGWVCTGQAQSATWYVDPVNGNDEWTGSWMEPVVGTKFGPWRTLGTTVSRAQTGDMVVLLDGVYEGEENIAPPIFSMLSQKQLFFYGLNGPYNCILALTWNVMMLGQALNNGIETVFNGVTFTQAPGSNLGAEIYVHTTRVYFDNCIFKGFQPGESLLRATAAHLIFSHCQFVNNQKNTIVNMLNEAVALDMNYCEFVGNSSQTLVGAASCAATIRNCTFRYNAISYQPMICVKLYYNKNALVENCTFENNSSNQYFCAIQTYLDGRTPTVPVIRNCSVTGNVSVSGLSALEFQYGGSAKIEGCTISDNRITASYECLGILSMGTNLAISDTAIERLGSYRSDAGAIGISCINYKQLSVEDCKINYNHIGIRLQPGDGSDGSPNTAITNVEFVGNATRDGLPLPQSAALRINSMPHPFTMSHCDFKDNGSTVFLNGVAGHKPFAINNCLFTDNRGLAMRLESPADTPITLNNCTLNNNGDFTLIFIEFNNCIINNSGGLIGCSVQQMRLNYCCFPVAWTGPGTGNFVADPLFADAVNGDYHLKSLYGRYDPFRGSWVRDNVHSLCIDAGNPSDPVGREPYGSGGRINVGRYGGTPEASKSAICAGGEDGTGRMLSDFNRDCDVNLSDLAVFAAEWLHSTKVQQTN